VKTLLDFGPAGRAGIEARINVVDCTIWIPGTDRHWYDVLHHIAPGAGAREARAARDIADYAEMSLIQNRPWKIAGHSLGGAVAVLVADNLLQRGMPVEELILLGPKRAQWRRVERQVEIEYVATVIRNKGDIVPFFPPWRRRYKDIIVQGPWDWPWRAHSPTAYDGI